jgi:DNA-binding transcriptional MocR family regulator
MPEERKVALLDLLATHGVPLIEDDIYGDIHFGSQRPVPFMALDRHDNTIYCSSFSKTIAPGYRIGWVASRRHMSVMLENKFALTLSGAALPQVALADFLASGGYDRHLRRLRRAFADNLHQMIRTLERVFPQGTRVSQPAGGFVLWVELPHAISTRALFLRALEAGVCFAPGDVFSASDRYSNCMRLSCGQMWDERMEDGLRLLGGLAHAAMV